MGASGQSGLSAIAPWFGGKRSLAPTIVEELGPHRAYFEPFCGSAAVLFAKPICSIETINDLHADLVTTAMVLASERWRTLYEEVDRYLICQELVDAWVGEMKVPITRPLRPADVEPLHVSRAAKFIAASWISRNGCAGTERTNYQIAVRWTQGGGSAGIRWRAAVDSVPYWHDRLKGVVILNRDGFDVLDSIEDQEGTTIYVDPPYLAESRGGGGGSRYVHDFDESEEALFGGEDDHMRLGRTLARFKKGRVVVSYYDHPRVRELYAGWSVRECTMHKNLHVQNKRGSTKSEAPEILLLNGRSFADVVP